MEDRYRTFAYDYDQFGGDQAELTNEENFLDQLFKENNVRKVLDCACGTGRHLLMLSELGYNLSGSDYSAAMLKVARENLAQYKDSISFKQCDFRCLESAFEERFDALLCMANSLPHLLKEQDLICALKSMKKRLKARGLLVLSSGTTPATLKLPPIEVVVHRKDFSRIFVKEYDGRLQTVNIIDLFHSRERMETRQYKMVYRVLSAQDYKRLLSDAGYESVVFYGDYHRAPYGQNSRKLIVVATA